MAMTTHRALLDDFVVAETHCYFKRHADKGAMGKFVHNRSVASADANQTVVRMNQDVLYSAMVMDLRKSPVVIALPSVEITNRRYVSLQIISETHNSSDVAYEGTHTISLDSVGTPFAMAIVRVGVKRNDAYDESKAWEVQDAIRVSQDDGGPGSFSPDVVYNATDVDAMRKSLRELKHYFRPTDAERLGDRHNLDRLAQLMGAASGWGGLRAEDATYSIHFPPSSSSSEEDDGGGDAKNYVIHIPPEGVPLIGNGFWSVTVYDKDGFLQPQASVNSTTATVEEDGSIIIGIVHDSNRDDAFTNVIAQAGPGWSYTVRIYRPGRAVLDGTFKFPEAVVQLS